jgi:hypothetical protein
MTITRPITTGLAIALVAAGALAAAGCGGSDGAGRATGANDDAKQLAFARCMREAGIDFPDPKPSSGPQDQAIRIPRSISPKRFQGIEQGCRRSSGIRTKPPSAAEQARFRDDALKFARCMRAHGIDLPDPQMSADGGGVIIQKKQSAGSGGGSAPALDSPAFRRAQAACPSGPMSRKLSGGAGSGAVLSQSGPAGKR